MIDLAGRVVGHGAAQGWIAAVTRRLALGEHVLALFPPTVDPAPVVQRIVVAAEERGCRVSEVDLADLHPAHPPLLSLPAALGVSDRLDIRTLEAFAELPGLPDVIHATSLERLPPGRIEQWVTLLQRMARMTGDNRTRAPAIFCPVSNTPEFPPLPPPAPGLALMWWSGIPSATELRLACREESDPADRPRRLWREHLLSSMCGDDVGLVERLWDVIFESHDTVRHSLLKYAQERGWTRKALEQAGASAFVASPIAVSVGEPPRERALWMTGALSTTEEFGTELHVAAMAALDRDADWMHRVWRGQAMLILPLLEDLRLRVCRSLSETFGDNWPFRWQPPMTDDERREVMETPLAASWGFLAHLYRTVPVLGRDVRTASLIQRARVLRNELSHNRTVSYVDFKAVHDQMSAFIAGLGRGGS